MRAPRCPVGMPLDIMEELRKIKTEHHTTIVGAIALLINLYKAQKND